MDIEPVKIHRSLTQPIKVSGAERNVTMLIATISGLIFFVGMSFKSAVVALLTWWLGMTVARYIAKMDPQMLEVYLRHIAHSDYYPATARINTPIKKRKKLNKPFQP